MKKATGPVIHWNDNKGYGFLKDKTTNESFFFHFSAIIEGTPIVGNQADFIVIKSRKRPGELQASEVVIKGTV